MKSTDILKSIKEFEGINKNNCYFPPIMDYSAEQAAACLTIEDSKNSMLALRQAFRDQNVFPILEYVIHLSHFNYKWFTTFLNKIEELNEEEITIVPPLDDSRPTVPLRKLIVYPPFHYTKGLHMCKFTAPTKDPINLYRINYIKECIPLDSFREGFPSWYIFNYTTVFERYNSLTNKRVRLDFIDGEFIYYISGASDDWKQIHDIPIEMDYVVAALLFRN